MIYLALLAIAVTILGFGLFVYSVRRNIKAKQEIIKINKELDRLVDIRKQVEKDMENDSSNN